MHFWTNLDAPAMRAAVAGLADTSKADVEYRQRAKNGDYRWLSDHMSLAMDSSGRPLYRKLDAVLPVACVSVAGLHYYFTRWTTYRVS